MSDPGDFVDRILVYHIDLEIKDTTYTARSASCLDIHPQIDNEGRLRTKLYDKRDDFNIPFVNSPHIHLYVAKFQQHLHTAYMSQLI